MLQALAIEVLMSTFGSVIIIVIFYEILFFPLHACSTHTIL